eukprot:11171495-Lingulodinium_polyedra.AAC.1
MAPGTAFVRTLGDPDDRKPWGFNDEDKASDAEAWVRKNKPVFLVGSPMCAACSQFGNVSSAGRAQRM